MAFIKSKYLPRVVESAPIHKMQDNFFSSSEHLFKTYYKSPNYEGLHDELRELISERLIFPDLYTYPSNPLIYDEILIGWYYYNTMMINYGIKIVPAYLVTSPFSLITFQKKDILFNKNTIDELDGYGKQLMLFENKLKVGISKIDGDNIVDEKIFTDTQKRHNEAIFTVFSDYKSNKKQIDVILSDYLKNYIIVKHIVLQQQENGSGNSYTQFYQSKYNSSLKMKYDYLVTRMMYDYAIKRIRQEGFFSIFPNRKVSPILSKLSYIIRYLLTSFRLHQMPMKHIIPIVQKYSAEYMKHNKDDKLEKVTAVATLRVLYSQYTPVEFNVEEFEAKDYNVEVEVRERA